MPKKKKSDKTLQKLQKESGLTLKELFTGETLSFVIGIILFFVSVFMTLAFVSYISTAPEDQSYLESLSGISTDAGSTMQTADVANQAGRLGARTAYFFMNNCFGFAAFFIPFFLIMLAMRLMRTYKINMWRILLNSAFLMIWLSVALAFFTDRFHDTLAFYPGGKHGKSICEDVASLIGTPGLLFLIIISAILYLIYLSKRTITVIRKLMHPEGYVGSVKSRFESLKNRLTKPQLENETELTPDTEPLPVVDAQPAAQEEPIPQKPVATTSPNKPKRERKTGGDDEFTVTEGKNEEEAGENTLETKDYDPKLDLEFYKYPTLDLLKKYEDQGSAIDDKEQTANKERITRVLRNFGVEISTISATVGPTVTLYEITPAQGVRISKIKNLEDDIALSLSALGIRIIAPIPGKGTIGIEVPNKKPQIVSIESILNSKKFKESDFELPIALGKTNTNEVYMTDLAKMPHLLVAGATGQGKSVGLNAIITSLLYKKHPSELKIVLVDPKKVEFSIYAPLEKHFLAKVADDEDPIITDVTKVVRTLKSLCQEMDDRYALLKRAACRNIKEYNAKFKSRQLNPENGHRFLPYFVIIIDEFGDLIMTAGKEVEVPIARIAQLARAVGMHMVIATQRPTTNIITGTIKANFPARMAFKVMSQIDSRTILDQSGANQLVGKGDMLIISGGAMPVRVQCAFIDTPEVLRINEYISQQQGYLTAYELPDVPMDDEGGSSGGGIDEGEKLDSLFEEAARLIVVHQSGSTSLIQRKFAIGYNRAGRLMDQLERAGIVGGINGAKPREVLCADEAALQRILDGLNTAS